MTDHSSRPRILKQMDLPPVSPDPDWPQKPRCAYLSGQRTKGTDRSCGTGLPALRYHLMSAVAALALTVFSSASALAQTRNPYDSQTIAKLLKQVTPTKLPNGLDRTRLEAAAEEIAGIVKRSRDLRFDEEWPLERALLGKLARLNDPGATNARYPGGTVTPEAAKSVADIATKLRSKLPQLRTYVEWGRPGNPNSWVTPEFKANWGLAATNAQYAYSYNENGFSGVTGKGVKVGVLDSGISSSHSKFQGRLHLLDVKGAYGTPQPRYQLDDNDDQPIPGSKPIPAGTPFNVKGEFDPAINAPHGTEMTGTIGAARNGAGMHGVAFESDLYFANTGGTDNNRRFSSNDLDYNYFNAAYSALGNAGVRIVNNSWGQGSRIGLEAEVGNVADRNDSLSHLTYAYRNFWAKNQYTDGTGGHPQKTWLDAAVEGALKYRYIQVFSADNQDHAANPDVGASQPFFHPQLEGAWVAATGYSYDPANKNPFAQVYNQCGVAKWWCLMGVSGVTSTMPDGMYTDNSNGTSSSSPNISGALALVMQRYPYLNSEQALNILFTTARIQAVDPNQLKDDVGNSLKGAKTLGVLTQVVDSSSKVPNVVGGWGVPDLKKAMHGPGQLFGHFSPSLPSGTRDEWSNDISDEAIRARRADDQETVGKLRQILADGHWDVSGLSAVLKQGSWPDAQYGGSLTDDDRQQVEALVKSKGALTDADREMLKGLISELENAIATRGLDPVTGKTYVGSLTMSGSGTLVLSGTNTFRGSVTLEGGELSVGKDANLGAASSVLAFNGGTLQVTGTNFTSTPRTIIWGDAGGGFDIADGANAFTVAQSLSGKGGLAKLGAGALVLSGANNYGGATTVSSGILRAGSTAGFSSASDFNLATGATLDVGGFDNSVRTLTGQGGVVNSSTILASLTVAPPSGTNSTFAGRLSGATLAFGKAGAGMVVLPGTNFYGGGTLISGGTLGIGSSASLGSGLVTMMDATALQFEAQGLNLANAMAFPDVHATIDTQGFNATLSGAISGSGGLDKVGSGLLTLTSASSVTGASTVEAGGLVVDGSIARSAVTVRTGASLVGRGVVGAITAQAGSTVAPGRVVPFSTLSVAGNVTFAQGSTYEVNINPAGLSDHLLVGGSATLQGGAVSALSGSGLYLPGLRYNLIATQGGISGTFAQLSTTTNLAFLTPLLSYDASNVYLAFAQTVMPVPPPPPTTPGTPSVPRTRLAPNVTPVMAPVSFASVALTHNQAATAAAVQTLGLGNAVYNAVLNQSVSGARQAFDALSGEVRASAVTAGFEDSRLPREAILDRLSQPLDTPFLGVTSTMMGAYAADLPSGKGRALAPVEVTMVRPNLFGLWGQGFGDWGRTGSDHNAAKLTRATGGFIIGADAGQQFFGGNWHFGLAGGYSDDSLKVSGRASSGNYQTIFGALYGAANYGAVDLKAGTVIASTDTHTSRSIAFPLFSDQASAHNGGTAAQAFGEAGYHIPVAVLPGVAADLEPVLQGALIHLVQDRSVETSLSGAGLIGASKGYDLATTTFGLRGEYRLAGLPGWTLQSMVGWRHAFGDVTPSVTQSFAGTFSSFTVSGVPVDRNALTTQASLDYAFDERLTVGLSYSGQFGHRASDNAFKGNIALKF